MIGTLDEEDRSAIDPVVWYGGMFIKYLKYWHVCIRDHICSQSEQNTFLIKQDYDLIF